MRDMLGNKLEKGAMLYWTAKEIMVHVVDVSEPTLEGNDTPPTLTIAMQIPVMGVQKGKEVQLGEFLMPVNPKSETLLDRLEKGRTQ